VYGDEFGIGVRRPDCQTFGGLRGFEGAQCSDHVGRHRQYAMRTGGLRIAEFVLPGADCDATSHDGDCPGVEVDRLPSQAENLAASESAQAQQPARK
jgi:hypothetical protein